MSSLELQVVSKIIESGDLRAAQRRGILPEHFHTEEARELYRWIADAYADPRHPGLVPSLEKVQRTFTNFDPARTRDSLDILLTELIDDNVRVGIREVIEDVESMLEEGMEPELVLQSAVPDLRDLMMVGGGGAHQLLSQASPLLLADYERVELAGGMTGIPFPWLPLNDETMGLQPEDFMVIYGRPKNMKTWVACAIVAFAYHKANCRVLVYSKEMATKLMMRRVASVIAGVDYFDVKKAKLRPEDKEEFFRILDELEESERRVGSRRTPSMSFLNDKLLRSRGSKGATVDMIAAEAEKFDADLVLVDGFYLMRDGRTGIRGRDWKQIANISSDLKDMAQGLGIPVIGTTQAKRGADQTKGDDLEELGFADAIGQDADIVTRVFKGKNAATGKPKVMMTFPGVRDSVLNPFVINAWPGVDFSLLQSTVNVTAFLNDKKGSDEEENNKAGIGNSAKPVTRKGADRKQWR